jgi:LCP family protein required for cell wall assembly
MAALPDPPRSDHGHTYRALLAVTASLALVVSMGAGIGYASFIWAQRSFQREESGQDPAHPGKKIIDPICEKGCNYLLLGSDSRTHLDKQDQQISGTNADIGGTYRSDTIMVVHVPAGEQRAVVLSFPRDLWVNIPGHGTDKINSSFEGGLHGGGPDLVARTVEQLTGLKMNHFLYVDLGGFQGVVDALGGVRLCVPYPMQDPLTGLDIRAGCQDFDGRTALAYVRTRHQPCDANAPDFARIGRQQQFLRAVITKMLSPSELPRLPGLVGPVAHNMTTDDKFELVDMVRLVRTLQGVSTGAVDFRSVPGTPALIQTPSYPTGISIVKMDPSARDMFRDLRDDKPLGTTGEQLAGVQISEATIATAVYDKNSGGGAAEIEKVLGESGFNTGDGIPLTQPLDAKGVKGSAIVYGPGALAKQKADVVATYFPDLKMVKVDKGALTQGDVGIVVTSGYQPQPVGTGNGTTPNCAA